ncbi:MAG: phospholipase D-like domain-containing protein, partial [Patescibacteria group bacterium]
MTLINNSDQNLEDALKNALSASDSIDIAVGFFYFSGFQALSEELRDKKIRILVGLELDPTLIPEIVKNSKEGDVDLTKYQNRNPTTSNLASKLNYTDSFVGFINDSDIFDDKQSSDIFDLYIEKIQNGTLEIRKTLKDYHGKFYVVKNKKETSQNGDFPGTVFVGSSNFTYKGLVGQGELNEPTRDKNKFYEYTSEFEKLWTDSESIGIADINTKEDFLDRIKPRIWKYSNPSPYNIYIRVLYELFYNSKINDVKTPGIITKNQYINLEYQIDAIKMVMDRLNRFDGGILADVVGLGKSIIASAVANNMGMKTVIIVPPHLISQWEDYKEEFS